MSSSSVSPRTPSLPSAAAPNTDVSALMPNHPPSLKFHPDTRHTDSCGPYRLHCIHLTDSDTRSFSPPHSCRLIGLVWGLRRDAYQWMTDFFGQHWVAEWRRWRSKFRYLSAELVSCLPESERVLRGWESAVGRWKYFNLPREWMNRNLNANSACQMQYFHTLIYYLHIKF